MMLPRKTPSPKMCPGQLAGMNQLDHPATPLYQSLLRTSLTNANALIIPRGPLRAAVEPSMAPQPAPVQLLVDRPPMSAPTPAPISAAPKPTAITLEAMAMAAIAAVATTTPATTFPTPLMKSLKSNP